MSKFKFGNIDIDFYDLRCKHDLTTRQLADKINIDPLKLNSVELGKSYDNEIFAKLCRYYKLKNVNHEIKHLYNIENPLDK